MRHVLIGEELSQPWESWEASDGRNCGRLRGEEYDPLARRAEYIADATTDSHLSWWRGIVSRSQALREAMEVYPL